MFIRKLILLIYKKTSFYLARVRNYYHRCLFGNFGEGSAILGNITLYHPENISFGKYSTLNEGVLLNARSAIKIGNYVHISPYVIINAGGLDYRLTMNKRAHISKPVLIGDGVWICSGAIINPGVTIGRNSVVGAGAVVTKSIPENCVAVGVPAKVTKKIGD